MTLRPVDVDAMQRAKDNLAYDTQPGALPTVWYWPDDGYDSIKRVDAATVRALATTIAALQRENAALREDLERANDYGAGLFLALTKIAEARGGNVCPECYSIDTAEAALGPKEDR